MPLLETVADLRSLLTEAQVIAVVGHSDNPERTSYRIAHYLREAGYTVYPVNPGWTRSTASRPTPAWPSAGADRHRERISPRRAPAGHRAEAIAVGAKAVWGQLGVTHPEALRLADEAGLALVMDRCIKTEHLRVFGDEE
jgi:predicted CoA-binding protein